MARQEKDIPTTVALGVRAVMHPSTGEDALAVEAVFPFTPEGVLKAVRTHTHLHEYLTSGAVGVPDVVSESKVRRRRKKSAVPMPPDERFKE